MAVALSKVEGLCCLRSQRVFICSAGGDPGVLQLWGLLSVCHGRSDLQYRVFVLFVISEGVCSSK